MVHRLPENLRRNGRDLGMQPGIPGKRLCPGPGCTRTRAARCIACRKTRGATAVVLSSQWPDGQVHPGMRPAYLGTGCGWGLPNKSPRNRRYSARCSGRCCPGTIPEGRRSPVDRLPVAVPGAQLHPGAGVARRIACRRYRAERAVVPPSQWADGQPHTGPGYAPANAREPGGRILTVHHLPKYRAATATVKYTRVLGMHPGIPGNRL